jgi:hypothetical protein
MVAPVRGEIAAFSLQDGKRQEAKGFLGHRGMEWTVNCGDVVKLRVFFQESTSYQLFWDRFLRFLWIILQIILNSGGFKNLTDLGLSDLGQWSDSWLMFQIPHFKMTEELQ